MLNVDSWSPSRYRRTGKLSSIPGSIIITIGHVQIATNMAHGFPGRDAEVVIPPWFNGCDCAATVRALGFRVCSGHGGVAFDFVERYRGMDF